MDGAGKIIEYAKEITIALVIAVAIYKFLTIATGSPLPFVTVVSDSMLPIIHRGDLLFVVRPAEYRTGDIVVYEVSVVPYPIVHRLIGREEVDGTMYWKIKGDNNPDSDPWLITDQNIRGKVVLNFPLLGLPRMLMFRMVGR